MSDGRIAWLSATDAPDSFPNVELALAEPDGLLAAGGDLRPERLLAAYSRGIFPWYEEGQPILWWSPDPRCILRPAELHVSRRLHRYMRRCGMQLRFNSAFGEVLRRCAGGRRSQQGTWITADMQHAFLQLHEEGWAHSIEIWDGDELAGGLYGLCIGEVFFGESMFSGRPNTSKMALAGLARHMQDSGLELLDCQVASPHLLSMGAGMLPRAAFLSFLERACRPPRPHRDWPRSPVDVASLLVA